MQRADNQRKICLTRHFPSKLSTALGDISDPAWQQIIAVRSGRSATRRPAQPFRNPLWVTQMVSILGASATLTRPRRRSAFSLDRRVTRNRPWRQRAGDGASPGRVSRPDARRVLAHPAGRLHRDRTWPRPAWPAAEFLHGEADARGRGSCAGAGCSAAAPSMTDPGAAAPAPRCPSARPPKAVIDVVIDSRRRRSLSVRLRKHLSAHPSHDVRHPADPRSRGHFAFSDDQRSGEGRSACFCTTRFDARLAHLFHACGQERLT